MNKWTEKKNVLNVMDGEEKNAVNVVRIEIAGLAITQV